MQRQGVGRSVGEQGGQLALEGQKSTRRDGSSELAIIASGSALLVR